MLVQPDPLHIALRCFVCGAQQDLTLDQARELGRELSITADALALGELDRMRSRPTARSGSRR